jgi:hypothetical protein
MQGRRYAVAFPGRGRSAMSLENAVPWPDTSRAIAMAATVRRRAVAQAARAVRKLVSSSPELMAPVAWPGQPGVHEQPCDPRLSRNRTIQTDMSPWRVNRVNDLVRQPGSPVRPVQPTVLHEPTWGWHATRTTFPPSRQAVLLAAQGPGELQANTVRRLRRAPLAGKSHRMCEIANRCRPLCPDQVSFAVEESLPATTGVVTK